MINLKIKRIFKLFPINFFLVITLFIASCEQEEIFFNPEDLQLEIPQFSIVDEAFNLSCTSETYTDIKWQISDGTVYDSKKISHTFSKPGIYTIILTVFKNGKVIQTLSQSIEVYYNHRTYFSKNGFYALRSFVSQNRIILEGYPKNSQNKALIYLVFDMQINCIDTITTIDDLTKELNSVFELENILFGVNWNDDGSSSTFKLKSTDQNTGIHTNSINNDILNYVNGFVHYYENENSDFMVDYYDNNLTKLWTKKFTSENTTATKYLFNIKEKLFYLSFDKNYDSLYINNFKNVSLAYGQYSFSLGCKAENRNILFAFSNSTKNTITLAVYSKEKDITSLYSIDENCSLSLLQNIPGLLKAIPVELQVDGSVISKSENKLIKYSYTWESVAEKEMNSGDYGIGSIGSNLYLIFENLPAGLKLSFVDKHLNTVNFN